MKKQLLRVKQLADQTFARAEKSEVLSEDLVNAERRVDHIKQSCQNIVKKLQGYLQGQGTDGASVEKRMRKVAESLLGNSMMESAGMLGGMSVFGKVLAECGPLEVKIGSEIIQHEIQLEQLVLGPLQQLLDVDIPNIMKQRRNLNKLTLDMDSARTRYHTAAKTSAGWSTNNAKADNIKEELEDAQQKVEQCRDALAAEMFHFMSREGGLAELMLLLVKLQRDYHKAVFDILDHRLNSVESLINDNPLKPAYGINLEEHLRVTERQVAYPVELCVCALLELGIQEEGLFRVAGGASRVRKLKTAFDTGLVDLPMILEFRDPHVIAGALKSYLRELPDPLMTTKLYDEWMAAARVQDSDSRLQALWQVVHKLPEQNFDNLRYLIKFLAQLATNQESNKMGSHNIAIVMTPNLIWNVGEDGETVMGMNMSMTNTHSAIVDSLVTYADWFFPGEIDFYVTCPKLPQDTLPPTPNGTTGSSSTASTEGHRRTSSAEGHAIIYSSVGSSGSDIGIKRAQSNSSLSDHSSPPLGSPKPALRRKNKPAPVPPVQNEGKFKPDRPEKPPRLDGTGSLPRHFTRNTQSFPQFPPQFRGAEDTEKSTSEAPPPLSPKPTLADQSSETVIIRRKGTESKQGSESSCISDIFGMFSSEVQYKSAMEEKTALNPTRKPVPATRMSLMQSGFDVQRRPHSSLVTRGEEKEKVEQQVVKRDSFGEVGEKPGGIGTEVEKSIKPVVPVRPVILRNMQPNAKDAKTEEKPHEKGALEHSGSITIEVNKSERPVLERTHIYSVDKQQVSIVHVGSSEHPESGSEVEQSLGHGRTQSLGRIPSEKTIAHDASQNPTKSDLPIRVEEDKSASSQLMSSKDSFAVEKKESEIPEKEGCKSEAPANTPPSPHIPSRPPRPQPPAPPPVPPTKPRSTYASESTDL